MIFYLFLLLILLYLIYRATHSYKPEFFFNKQGSISDKVIQLQSKLHNYKPTFWLFNCHFQTIWGMRFRPSSKLKCERDQLTLPDGGTVILDIFSSSNIEPISPIVMIIHTLTGGTREPCTNNLAEVSVKKGWRAIVLNCRGCSGAPITSQRFYNAYEMDDIQCMIQHIKEKYHPSHLFLVGFSCGANQLSRFSTIDTSIDASACISHTYDLVKAGYILDSFPNNLLYQKVIMEKLSRMLKKSPYYPNHPAIKAKKLYEFDDWFTCKNLGFANWQEYYEKLNIYDQLPQLKVPLLIFGSEDDPFTRKELLPKKQASESDLAILISVPEGGHVSFIQGIDGKRAYYEDVLLSWFELFLT